MLVVPVNILGEVLLLDLVVASTVELRDTGLEIAKLETGRTNVIAVVKEAILKEIARTVRNTTGDEAGFFLLNIVVYICLFFQLSGKCCRRGRNSSRSPSPRRRRSRSYSRSRSYRY